MTERSPDFVPAVEPPLIEVEDLVVHFPIRRGLLGRPRAVVKAVDGVSMAVRRGETLGLVGESGCGKSTTGRAILQLVPPTGGAVRFEGRDLLALRRDRPPEFRRMRRHMQMIFQDPYASLNPRMTVGDIVAEPIRTHRLRPTRRAVRERVAELLDLVGLSPALARRYPHAFSGGQRQRIGVARALASDPDFLVCDEPISALDVSIQAQVLNLLDELQERLGLTYLFIAHDIGAVRHVSTRIAVMYLGHIVEEGPSRVICEAPAHPYTQALISAVPIPDPDVERARQPMPLREDVELPSPINPPSGCVFHTRCPYAWDRCALDVPRLRPVTAERPEHRAACHLLDEPSRREADKAQSATPMAAGAVSN